MKYIIIFLSMIFVSGCTTIYNQSIVMQMQNSELEFYTNISSDNSLAPNWFKNSTSTSLNGIVADENRGVFFVQIIFQCSSLRRLFALWIVLYIPLYFIFFLNLDGEDGSPFLKFFAQLWFTFLLYLFARLLSWFVNLIIYAFTGGNHYMPYPFVFFCLLALGIFICIALSIKPVVRVAKNSKKPLVKVVRIISLAVSVISGLFTALEFFRRAGYTLWIDKFLDLSK